MTGIASVRSWVMVICSLIPRAYLHSHFLAKIRANCEQSVPEYRTARDERPRGSENRPCAQLRLLGMGSAGLCKEGNARKTLRRGDESCGAAPLGSYGRFYTNLCAIPSWHDFVSSNHRVDTGHRDPVAQAQPHAEIRAPLAQLGKQHGARD